MLALLTVLRLLVALAVPYVATQGVLRWVGCSYLVRLISTPLSCEQPVTGTWLSGCKSMELCRDAQVVSACYRFSYLLGLCLIAGYWVAGRVRYAVVQLQMSIYNERYLVGSALRDNLNAGVQASTAVGER